MAFVLIHEKSPADFRQFYLKNGDIRGKKGRCFIYFQDVKKIYGPVDFIPHGSRLAVQFHHRRGVHVTEPFYIRLSSKKHVEISEIQEQMLFNELEFINRTRGSADILSLRMERDMLRVRLLRQRPSLMISDFAWRIDRTAVKNASRLIHAELKLLCREKSAGLEKESILRLRFLGRELYTALFHDGFFLDYFSGQRNAGLCVELSPELFFVPFEHMAIKELFLLEFRLTRLLEHKPGHVQSGSLDRNGMLVLYDGSSCHFEKEAMDVMSTWSTRTGLDATALDVRSVPAQRISELYSSNRYVHYSGHAALPGNQYRWMTGKKRNFDPLCASVPEFIFADACHAHFYTEHFHGSLSRFFRNGLRFWLSGMDEIRVSGSGFADLFYTELAKTGSFGHSLLQSRRISAEKGRSDFLQYISCGDQNFSFRKEHFSRGSC